MVRQTAGRVEPLHQHLERHILMLIGSQAALPHPRQQLAHRGITGDVHPQHQGVDEKTHHVIQRRVAPPGDRKAHRHIRTRAHLGQQHRQRGLHHHETGGIMRPRQPRYLLLQLRRPLHRDTGAAEIGHHRIRPIGGQFQPLGHARQGVLPVAQLTGDQAVRVVEVTELGALPQRVIDILHRQRHPIRDPPRRPTRIRPRQVTHQRRQRPPVRGNMMHHRHQQMLLRATPQKHCTQRNFSSQVKGMPGGVADGVIHSGRRPATGVDDLPADVGTVGRQHHLGGRPVGRGEHRAQALVPGHDIMQCGAQRADVHRPVQPQRGHHVVHRGRPVQLADEPQPRLRERQRHHRRPLGGHHRGEPVPAFAEARRQLRNGGRFEQHSHRQPGVEAGVDGGDHPHRRQRITAQVEERVVDTNPVQAEHLGVDAGDDLLGGSGRRPVCPARVFRRRQGPGVQFPVGSQRQRLDRQHRGGNHVGRQPLGQPGADRRRVGGAGEVADDPFLAGAVLAGDHRYFPDAVQFGQRRMDFAQLDAVAANLDLLIGPGDVVQSAVAIPAHQIAGAVHPRTGVAERAGHEPRRRQTGPAQIAGGHPGAGDIELAGHTGRHLPQPRVQHEQRRTRYRGAEWGCSGAGGQRCAEHRVDGGFRGAVGVDHHPAGRPPVGERGRAGLAADHQRRVQVSW
ncbi:hypothetical protein PICSAR120_04300 [Mycobacterium avium subsp. paratuberculosis]|nr:hypothetical protein PICSAR120_04300 [Mycobacterium avium subsp. paratuberculosis]CAG6934352.1 hypothetical protein PICSAR107_04323 [Mycobacterium avium subsp. paratuberculosis]CAG6982464.1 hypothetical protein PICSAR164_01845 [Mycobacterium avium subsp. paratuberculosis]CAG6987652.1 hypothetical protein PICSAR14_02626 [Mycobacterium avium subsp. paratuberculosis]CAG7206505.1 hypothetical protein PICSAR235_04254 [Mycobacterium avium subsp. paratuberculosis]